jgi:ketosteroid isomerase-like protein
MGPVRPDRSLAPSSSLLDVVQERLAIQPFFHETVRLLRAVRDHDMQTLAALCDDDFGIVDIAPDGSGVPIRDRAEWEAWFDQLFRSLTAMDATTDSEVLDYRALVSGDLGYGVLDFRQTLTVDHTATFDCIATVIRKRTPTGWRESRWHYSVISSDVALTVMCVAMFLSAAINAVARALGPPFDLLVLAPASVVAAATAGAGAIP